MITKFNGVKIYESELKEVDFPCVEFVTCVCSASQVITLLHEWYGSSLPCINPMCKYNVYIKSVPIHIIS